MMSDFDPNTRNNNTAMSMASLNLGARNSAYSMRTDNDLKVGGNDSENAPVSAAANDVGMNDVKKGKNFPRAQKTSVEGPLVGSDEYVKNQQEFSRIEALIKAICPGWNILPLVEKYRLVENEFSRKLLNLTKEDQRSYRVLLKQLHEKYVRQETESKHLLLERFFTKMRDNAVNGGFRARYANAYSSMNENNQHSETMTDDIRMSEALLECVRNNIQADDQYRQLHFSDPDSLSQNYTPSGLNGLREKFDHRLNDISRAYTETICNLYKRTNVNSREFRDWEIINVFGSRLMRLSKLNLTNILFRVQVADANKQEDISRYSKVSFNRDCSTFAALCGKGFVFFDYDKLLLNKLDEPKATIMDLGTRPSECTTFAWNPTRCDQLCLATLEKRNSGKVSLVDARVASTVIKWRAARGRIHGLDWECDGRKVVLFGGKTGKVSFWSPYSSQCLGTMNVVRDLVPTCVKFSPYKQNLVAVGYEDGSIALHDNRNLNRPWFRSKPLFNKGTVTGISFLPDNELVVTTMFEHPVVFKINGAEDDAPHKFKFVDNLSPSFYPMALSSHNDYIAVMGSDGHVRLFNRFGNRPFVIFKYKLRSQVPSQIMGCMDWHKSFNNHSLVVNYHQTIFALQMEKEYP